MRGRWKWLIGVCVLMVAGTSFYAREEKREEQYKTAQVVLGNVTESVSATGKVNAMMTTQVGSQVSGVILQLFADFNSHVKKGEVIAQIDPSIFRARVNQAKAKLTSDKAHVEKAQIVLSEAKRKLDRMETLFSSSLIAQQEKDAAATTAHAAEADLNIARAAVAQARAAQEIAEADLRHTTITSPVDGIVISRNVDVGQTVAASLQAPTLFTIAKDLTKMRVDISIDEADIGKIHIGQEVTFTVDAYLDTTFTGTIRDIYNQPIVLQNVVTYDAVIQVENPDVRLKPGMTANVVIEVKSKNNVLKIPNAALRYHPEPNADKTPDRHTSEVWVLKDGKEQAVAVTTGLSDGSFSEIVEGHLSPGDAVIVEKIQSAESKGWFSYDH